VPISGSNARELGRCGTGARHHIEPCVLQPPANAVTRIGVTSTIKTTGRSRLTVPPTPVGRSLAVGSFPTTAGRPGNDGTLARPDPKR
jgi:hypothetical protein